MKRFECEHHLEVAKAAVWIAWTASKTRGLGKLREKEDATREEVWALATGQATHDYPVPKGSVREIECDYVFGRMMKLTLKIGDGFIEYPDDPLTEDYQSWSHAYPTYEELLLTAKDLLKIFSDTLYQKIAHLLEKNDKLLFPLGNLYITQGAYQLFVEKNVSIPNLIERHLTLDQGALDDEDQQANRDALDQGHRILNHYKIDNSDESVYVITEYDRSYTTILLPSEY